MKIVGMFPARRPITSLCLLTRVRQLLAIIALISSASCVQFHEKPSPSPSSKMLSVNQNFDVSDLGKFLPRYVQSAAPTMPLMSSRLDNDNKLDAVSNDLFPDSPIFYFRLPVSAPSPYMYITEIENFVNHLHHPTSFVPYNVIPSSVPIHLPITFTSNGKPNSIYEYPQHDLHLVKPTSKPVPEPTSKPNIVKLKKGPYTFNGKPADIYLLQDTFNSLFSNSLSSLYP